MITRENYSQQLPNIPVKELPTDIKELHDFALESSDSGRNWDAYEDETVRPVIDHYFKKLNEFLSSRKEIVKPTEPEKKSEPRKVDQPKRDTKEAAKKRKTQNHKQEQEEDPENDLELVEKIPEEIRFIRRCISLHGKKKSKEDLLKFINAMHRAIIEKRIRKTSPYARQMNFIQLNLVKRYNSMTKPEVMSLSAKTLSEFKEIVASQKVMPSVSLIKRYISLNGKYGVKEKAKKLSEAMKRAISKGKVEKNDKYIKLYNDMLSNLNAFIKNKAQKVLDIEQAELNGLSGLAGLEVVSTKESGKQATKPGKAKILSSMDFKEMQFQTLGFKGKWLDLIGDPSKGFSVMVFGRPKMGKSILCIDFAGYLARNHGTVLYVAKEEGLDFTLQEKLKAKDVAHPNLFVTESIPENLDAYDFVFLDSVNKLDLSTDDLEVLKKNYPNITFIQIFQTTKMGAHKGKNDAPHNVDVVIEVPERGKAIQYGRFNQGGEMDIFPDDLDQAAGLSGRSGKKSIKADLKDKILYDILSPDGFTIRMPGDRLFKTKEEGIGYYNKWKKRFEVQGYYSANYGRIPLDELDHECSWEEVKKNDADSWLGFRQR